MESYEDFCTRSLAHLQAQGQTHGVATHQQGELSIIQFHGMPVLSPLLSPERRQEMTQYRQRAAALEEQRLRLRRSSLLSRVQEILDSAQVRKVPKEGDSVSSSCSLKPEAKNGFALLPDLNGLPKGKVSAGDAAPLRTREHHPLQHSGASLWPKGEEAEDRSCSLNLQSLLRKSREYLEREQSQRGFRSNHRAAPCLGESLSDKENESGDGSVSGGSGGEPTHGPGRSGGCSPNPPPPPSGSDSDGPDSLSLLPRSLTGSYARLPSPEPSLSPRVHRRRPRPLSAGHIVITCPLSACELSPCLDRQAARGEETSPPRVFPGDPGPAEPSTLDKRHSSPVPPLEAQDREAPVFRRRSQTMDSHLSPAGLRASRERVPGFLGGLPCRGSRRRSPAPLNQSYDVESPSPVLLRPCVGSPSPEAGSVRRRLELEGTRGSREGRLTPSQPARPGEEQGSQPESPGSSVGEELVKRQVLALEEMRRKLEKEHALQLSLLIAEQEREQERLRQELEEQERRLREQGSDLAQAGDVGDEWRDISESCPASTTLVQGEKSSVHTAHRMGFPAQLSSHAVQPTEQPPFYLWASQRGGTKLRGRMAQSVPPELHRWLCRLTAVAKGFLTRRLLQTEKVKHLRQTVQDTKEFIRTFQSEAPLKRGAISPQDMSLQERVLAQLRAALFDVHDIFFVMPLSERLGLLQQDRQLRKERKLREMEKAKSPREKVTLSVATQKSLDRKKQRVGDTMGQNKKTQQKPKSPPTNRVLQPNQGQNAPVPGHLHRQGSLYRKNPEERVKRSDSLRKQHSLG
nr:PREDICTED: centriolar coiled-coil protein of 110 kDa [Lepisosteus oculatus]XP_015215452.1 PREDICTED: centriolar coiled-coil protein of 110 kDa [Lepisosteus oculatus]XP_015215453.1 PREDICTED: centriolar coiled-coil protein of 110 kDa [Lepisosteus oculatus]